MQSKLYRLREFVKPADGRSLIADTSAGLSLGALLGLEDFEAAVGPALPLLDGVVASPGQARRLAGRTRVDAALLVRADWTNALRGPDFVLPPDVVSTLPLIDPADALDLGASALVLTFLLGHEEHVEAACLRATVQLALEGSRVGMPLIVDVQPIGPRVVLRSKAIELGVSYALEGGADGVAIPWPGAESFQTIAAMAAGSPVWVRPSPDDLTASVVDVGAGLRPALNPTLTPALNPAQEALDLGATGLWLGPEAFAQPDPPALFAALGALVHQLAPAGA